MTLPKPEVQRRKVLKKLDEIALEAAPEAMTTLANVAKGDGTVPREVISAATYILNQVLGRPGAKEAPTDEKNQVQDLLSAVRDLRSK
ncbi:MAG: hypothetical protein AB7Q01_08675 [Gammaproteobacteria bacterium]